MDKKEMINLYLETDDEKMEIKIASELNSAGVKIYMNSGYSELEAARKAMAQIIKENN